MRGQMQRLRRALVVAILCAAAISGLSASAADVKAVLATPVQRIEAADYRLVGRLVRVAANGQRTTASVTIKAHWFPGVLKILVEIDGPGKAREHVLEEMRPDGPDTIRVAHAGDAAAAALPFEKWSDGPLGGVFSYEDFLEAQFFWATQTVQENKRFGARECDMLVSTPASKDRTHYGEVRTWLDHSIGFPVYVEKTVKGSGAVKEFTYFGLRHDQGVWSASQVEVKTHGQAGSTLLMIDRGSAKANLTEGDFSTAKLARF